MKKVEQLDVGQGDAAWVHGSTDGLIDTGSGKALSEDRWLQLLAERQISKLSWIGLTHLDEDHAGGVARLAQIIPVHCVVTSFREIDSKKGKAFAEKLRSLGIQLRDWSSLCVPFPTLAVESPNLKKRNGNMGAVWIPLEKGGFYLSAGDADAKDEIQIGQWASKWTSRPSGPRILKISHHGSKSSSASEFLKTIRPTQAWISVGLGNRYGHPAPATLKKLNELGIPVLRTDRDGTLTLKMPFPF